MKRNVTKKLYLLVVLLPFFWGCRDTLMEIMHHEAGSGGVPVSVVVGAGGGGRSRTVAPDHVPVGDLENTGLYRLVLTGTSDMGGSVTVDPFRIANGMGGLDLPPGAWSLTLAAHTANNNTKVLEGTAFVIIVDYHVTVHIDLEPLRTADGTVSVQFTLPQSVVVGLDPAGNSSKTVTVALYDDGGQVVANTQQNFTVSAASANSSISYNKSVAAGQYTLRMSAPYTVNNASTGFTNRIHTLGWEDVLHVEGNRQSSVSVTLPGNALGRPGNPYLRDKYSQNGNSVAGNLSHDGSNFLNSDSFTPLKETLWLYGANWDTSGNDTNGNEVLVVSWNPVYNADYYELEILIHPFTRNVRPVASWGKFDRVVTTDAAWEALKGQGITYSGQTRTPSYMRYSGGAGDADNYRTKTWVINCNVNDNFLSCADKNLARSLFPNRGAAVGKVNSGYTLATTTDAFDTYSNWMYGSTNLGKVGLEAGCSVVGVLIPAFSPRMSLVYRLRAVNQFGHSDWVYWKGGKW